MGCPRHCGNARQAVKALFHKEKGHQPWRPPFYSSTLLCKLNGWIEPVFDGKAPVLDSHFSTMLS
jgi:hypothetical protein